MSRPQTVTTTNLNPESVELLIKNYVEGKTGKKVSSVVLKVGERLVGHGMYETSETYFAGADVTFEGENFDLNLQG